VNQISSPPNSYNFGHEFNYGVWTPDTIVDMVNVPWNNDYRDIVRFANRQALDDYIVELRPAGIKIEKMSFVKPNTPVRVNMPFNRAVKYNYLRASSSPQPVPGGEPYKAFYYFVTDVRYVAPNTTELVLQLDVWQTFGYDVKFGNCYVERGHIGIANSRQFEGYGRDYLTVPEGFDIGNEYRVIAKRSQDYLGMDNTVNNFTIGSNAYDIMVMSTTSLVEDPAAAGTIENPVLAGTGGTSISDVPSGASAYVFETHNSFNTYLVSMRDKPWVTQGIVHIAIVPKINRWANFQFDYKTNGKPTPVNNIAFRPRLTNMYDDWRNSPEIKGFIPERYRHLLKFFTYPYMGIEMTTWSGTPISLKPEAWWDRNAQVMARLTLALPNQRMQFIPRKYNSSGQKELNFRDLGDAELINLATNLYNLIRSTPGAPSPEQLFGKTLQQYVAGFANLGDDGGDYLDVMTQINQFPTGTITNNGGIAYLAANSHSIDYQRDSASWTQNRALAGNATSYDQATKGLETASALNNIAVNADVAQTNTGINAGWQQAGVSAGAGLVGGIVGGAVRGGPAGAAAGLAGGAISAAAGMASTSISASAANENLATRNNAQWKSLAAQQGQGGYIRDTNRSLSDWAARGDYANALAGIQSKVQDAAMIQPTVSGQYGGDAANHTHATAELSVRWKLIDYASIRRIGEYWLRYGYAVNLPIYNLPDDMMVMNHFTYWKMSETYLIAGPMPEAFKQAIRGIFEKGVTVWRNPGDIGRVDPGINFPIGGISF